MVYNIESVYMLRGGWWSSKYFGIKKPLVQYQPNVDAKNIILMSKFCLRQNENRNKTTLSTTWFRQGSNKEASQLVIHEDHGSFSWEETFPGLACLVLGLVNHVVYRNCLWGPTWLQISLSFCLSLIHLRIVFMCLLPVSPLTPTSWTC